MSISPLCDTFQTVFSAKSESAGRSCSMSALWKRVCQVGAGAIAAISSVPFFSGLRSDQSRVFQIFEGSSRFLFSLNNFEMLYGKLVEDSPGKAKKTALKTGVAALSLSLQVPLVLYSYHQNSSKNWLFPVAEGLCGSALTFASLWPEWPDNLQFFDVRRVSSDQEKRKQDFLDCMDAFIKDLPKIYKDLFLQQPDQSMILTMILGKYEERSKERDFYCDRAFRRTSAGVGIAAALYLGLYYQAFASEGILKWDETQDVSAALASGANLIVHLPVLGRMCMATSIGYYDTMVDVLTCRYKRSLAATAAPYLWTASRVSSLFLSYLSFYSISSAMKNCIPVIGETLSLFAPAASGLLLHDALNNFFDRRILAAKSLCNEQIRFISHLSDSLIEFREIFKDAKLEDIDTFFRDLSVSCQDFDEGSASYIPIEEFSIDAEDADFVGEI